MGGTQLLSFLRNKSNIINLLVFSEYGFKTIISSELLIVLKYFQCHCD